MLRISLIVICSCAGGNVENAVAQIELFERSIETEEERELETDRDAFTPATSTAGLGTAIFESSYSFIDNRSVAETHSFPEVLLRFGVSERIELRLGWNYEVGGTGDVVSGSEVSEGSGGGGTERESQVLYGLKASVTEQNDWLPRSAIILQGYTIRPRSARLRRRMLSRRIHLAGSCPIADGWIPQCATAPNMEQKTRSTNGLRRSWSVFRSASSGMYTPSISA